MAFISVDVNLTILIEEEAYKEMGEYALCNRVEYAVRAELPYTPELVEAEQTNTSLVCPFCMNDVDTDWRYCSRCEERV